MGNFEELIKILKLRTLKYFFTNDLEAVELTSQEFLTIPTY